MSYFSDFFAVLQGKKSIAALLYEALQVGAAPQTHPEVPLIQKEIAKGVFKEVCKAAPEIRKFRDWFCADPKKRSLEIAAMLEKQLPEALNWLDEDLKDRGF